MEGGFILKRLQTHRGFTLIELLTVVAIIGVLAAIAIPQYALYRQNAFDSKAQTDLRNVVTAEEEFYVANETYTSCANVTTCQSTLHGYLRSDNGILLAVTATKDQFTGTAKHTAGGGGTWRFDSSVGRFVYREP